MNRQQRRAAAARARKPAGGWLSYDALPDAYLRGFAMMAHAVDFRFADNLHPGGRCMLRAVVGFEVAHQCNLEARLDGSLLYRVGPDPARDVVAFCGRHNAGGEVGDAAGNHIFHAWLVMGDCIVDLSAIDWPAIDFCGDDIPGPAGELGPVQWTISVPPVLYGPRDECASSHDGL